MNARPELSSDDPQIHADATLAQSASTAQDFADLVRLALEDGALARLREGRLLLRAKERLPHGAWLAMFDRHLIERPIPYGIRRAQMAMRIAKHATLSKTRYLAFLPSSLTALYELALHRPEALEEKLAAGLITADLEVADVRALFEPPAPRADDSPLGLFHRALIGAGAPRCDGCGHHHHADGQHVDILRDADWRTAEDVDEWRRRWDRRRAYDAILKAATDAGATADQVDAVAVEIAGTAELDHASIGDLMKIARRLVACGRPPATWDCEGARERLAAAIQQEVHAVPDETAIPRVVALVHELADRVLERAR
jgi:hypothetical protein